jgi:hypothetical protein
VVYFLQNERTLAIKVGFTTNVKGRVRTLRTASPDRLRLLGVVPGDQGVERQVHRNLAAHRLAGEWFDGTNPAVLAEVCRRLDLRSVGARINPLQESPR